MGIGQPRPVVIDASVVVRAFVQEDGTNYAQEIIASASQSEVALHAPDILLLETAHALVKYHRRGVLTPADVTEAYGYIRELNITYHPVVPLSSQDLMFALQHTIGVYDFTHVLLSLSNGWPLVCVDQKLIDKVAQRVLVYTPNQALKALQNETL